MRNAEWIAIVAGALGSVVLTLYVGGSGFVLMSSFVGWVLLPYMAMGSMARVRRLALVLAPVSLAVFGFVAFGPRRAQPAFAFLVMPLVAWVAIGVAVVAGNQAAAQNKRLANRTHHDGRAR